MPFSCEINFCFPRKFFARRKFFLLYVVLCPAEKGVKLGVSCLCKKGISVTNEKLLLNNSEYFHWVSIFLQHTLLLRKKGVRCCLRRFGRQRKMYKKGDCDQIDKKRVFIKAEFTAFVEKKRWCYNFLHLAHRKSIQFGILCIINKCPD